MGALTFKQSSFNYRSWELTQIVVPDFIDDQGSLKFHLRGTNLVQISGDDWLRDRVRFSYDGYRRQRLINCWLNHKPITWSQAIQVWFDLIYNSRINLMVDYHQPYAVWIKLLLARLSWPSINGRRYAIDVNRYCQIYHGGYGLESTYHAHLVIPSQISYEELGVLSSNQTGFKLFSLMIVQLLRPAEYLCAELISPLMNHQSRSSACFQVSPLQRFLLN